MRASVCIFAVAACHLFFIAFLVSRQEAVQSVDHGTAPLNLPHAAPIQVSLSALPNVFESSRQPAADKKSSKEHKTASQQEDLQVPTIRQSDISDAASLAAEPNDPIAETPPRYFAEEHVAKKPAIIRGAEALRLEGTSIRQTVIVQLFVNELGRVDRVLVDMPEFNAVIHDAMVEAYSSMIFIPGKINGLPVKCQVTVQISI